MNLQFGGHETFVLREGWLHKGLKLLVEDPNELASDEAADALGVGQNMAKSIRYWLAATGLAERLGGKRGPLQLTELGGAVWQRDPYQLAPGTWWALHIQLAAAGKAGAWYWFFNHYGSPRFERAACLQSLTQYLQHRRKRVPTRSTLERDISCLLRSYAQALPPEPVDPEDGTECGFMELGLVQHFTNTGTYQRINSSKSVPPELIAYNIAIAWPEVTNGRGTVGIKIEELGRKEGGPGRILQLSAESLFEELQNAERCCNELVISGLGAERVFRLPQRSSLEWLTAYYDRIEKGEINAAA